MITDILKLSNSQHLIILDDVLGIYRDRNPADRGKIIKHWIRYVVNGKVIKTLYENITHAEYAIIKWASNYNQIVRGGYLAQDKITILQPSDLE